MCAYCCKSPDARQLVRGISGRGRVFGGCRRRNPGKQGHSGARPIVASMSGPHGAALQRERASLIDRLMGLSDGLFAIAMTLLILNIEVPDLAEGQANELAGDLAELDTKILVWLLSFAVLALLWRRQHVALDRLRNVDGVVVVLNFALLALASALPFSSDLFGEYSGQSVAVAVYAANVGLASLTLALISWWGELRGHQIEGMRRWDPLVGFLPSAIFLLSIPVALVDPSVAPYIWFAVLLIIPLRRFRHSEQST